MPQDIVELHLATWVVSKVNNTTSHSLYYLSFILTKQNLGCQGKILFGRINKKLTKFIINNKLKNMETLFENEVLIKTENENKIDASKNDILVIILLNKNFDFEVSKTPYDIEMYGKKMWEWVALACQGADIKTIVCTEESEILSLVRPYLGTQKWTVVLYSSTPLLSGVTFNEIMSYVEAKDINVLNLPKGYVFNTEYIKNIDSLLGSNVVSFGKKYDFFEVNSTKDLYEANQILKNRILDFHIANGVNILDKNSTFIDCDVIIESGTTIHQNNTISGQTYIGKNCTLEPNNVIKNSIISDNCVVKCSYIDQSRISENMIVGAFESVVNKSN